MKKILLLSLESINNGGDQMLGDTTQYLINNIGDFQIERIQLKPSYRDFDFLHYFEAFLSNCVKFVALKFKGDTKYKLYNLAYKIQLYRYYKYHISNCDAVIYAVGMLKYSTQNFSYVYHCVNKIASVLNRPVLMSAMSIEKPNTEDWRFHQLIEAVNFSSVKMITTRDGQNGLDRLRNYYIQRNNIITDFVGDPALWASQCYGIKHVAHNPPVIGVGLIRPSIYNDYEKGVSSDDLIILYKSLLKILMSQNTYEWYLFCNGMQCDYDLGVRLLKDCNLSSDKLLPMPGDAKKLVSLISNFDLVFGARMHACITSVSLSIPVAGLLWDNKLKFFSETMGVRNFFSESNELTGDNVYNKLMSAYSFKINMENLSLYKDKIFSSLKIFLESL